ncbi:GNAT family N-acetyltransferase [Actinophytocola gossypii]|uniref:GNAT family N-acetyltransferase n=1 Tax=Actinophytocola gossypii TaxID=2812003 RepID=A0ABT2J508_9PSEU|nr:GNAT family N-acetyltransferase [Actinophytocola gossypii]MCT2582873.1 GNAT family N-acetyltransferase [Actinophytocola gossypii]
MIRLAGRADLAVLREIERAAGEPFRDIGMAEIADDEPLTLDELAGYQADGRAWVYVDGAHPVAYLLVAPVDGHAHVEQVSVHPSHARRGIGARLLGAAERWAVARGITTVSLTTFTDVPWNAPYYARLGFTVLPDRDLPADLRAVRAREAAHGLDRWPRVTMVRTIRAQGLTPSEGGYPQR